jgi:hypothetical protein
MMIQTRPAATFTLILVAVFLLSGLCGTVSPAATHSTTDGLSITEDGSGQVTNLAVGGIQIIFAPLGTNGGFYVRDNTIDPTTGLPKGVTINEIVCGDFGDTLIDCETGDCLFSSGYWQWNTPEESGTIIRCEATVQSTPVALIEQDEDNNSWGLIYQDVTLTNPSSTVHDLYCLYFEMASECGWRSKDHPFQHEPWNGAHKITAYVEWFQGNPTGAATSHKNEGAIAISSIEAFNTSIELTPFALRTYKPLDADHARIKLVVEGFMPNDGRDESLSEFNYVVFDNVAFYKAPEIHQVVGAWNPANWVSLVDDEAQDLHLDMKLAVTANSDHLLFEGQLKNTALVDTEVRALDFGFALPIFDSGLGQIQHVEWYDDNHTKYQVGTPGLEQTLPFRMVGPADLRLLAGTDFVDTEGEETFVDKTNRDKGLNISAYPYSSIKITKGSNQGGLGFGDNLNALYPPISHFGYRVVHPTTPFLGWYYVEFSLGLLDRATEPDADTVPFSFVLFRSDIPGWSESSAFREGSEKYQAGLFPEFFSRPSNCDDDWLFGGGQVEVAHPESQGYHFKPNDFGIRYMKVTARDNTPSETDIKLLISEWEDPYIPGGPDQLNDVDILLYDHPWATEFKFDHESPPPPYDVSVMNTYGAQDDIAQSHSPSDLGLGPVWQDLYLAQKACQIRLPGVEPQTLLTRDLTLVDEDDPPDGVYEHTKYHFPVFLANKPIAEDDVVNAEIDYFDYAYTNISMASTSVKGLAGLYFDNTFYGGYNGLHLDILDELSSVSYDRQDAFVNAGGALTYSLSHLRPAISVIPLDTSFLDQARARLTDYDDENQQSTWRFGEGSQGTINTQDELLTCNLNSPYFGGSKYGAIRADVSVFESSPVLAFNNSSQAFDFRRTLTRQRNTTRLFNSFPCIGEWALLPHQCDRWDGLWGTSPLVTVYRQIVNEAIWISLAWGFHPSIHALLPKNNHLPEPVETIDEFVEEHIRDLFTGLDDNIGYTEISKQLHLAGWQPVTNAVAHDDGVALPLFVERFGPSSGSGQNNGNYFTVLNNDTLDFTLVQLIDEFDFGGPPSGVPFKYLPDLQAVRDVDKCQDVYDYECDSYPYRGQADPFFLTLKKEFYLDIKDPLRLGLWNGNLYGRQMVYNPEAAEDIVNWPEIIPAEFDETPYSQPYYSISRITSPDPIVRIGGPRVPLQLKVTIDDKALLVFKIWASLIVNNGPTGEGGERSGDSDSTEDTLVTAFYERYGQNWQRVETAAGYGGNLDLVPAADSSAAAYYRFTIGLGGEYRVMAHVPETTHAPAAARYEAYVSEYFEGAAGAAPLGEPVWSTVIDPATSENYNNGRDEDGFIEIGTVNIDVVEPELATVVVRLSAGETSSRYLLADAVKLVPVEGQE